MLSVLSDQERCRKSSASGSCRVMCWTCVRALPRRLMREFLLRRAGSTGQRSRPDRREHSRRQGAGRLPTREIRLADRRNMAFRGTVVTTGAGAPSVVASGARPEIGRIQALVNTATAPETPMQRQLAQLGRQLVWASAAFCGAYFVLGMMRGYGPPPMLKGAVSLAVAAIPEGLPTLATTTLALGIEDLKHHRVLIRRLDAVEGLSAIQVTCFDKTGTLTLACMSVVRIVTSSASFRFSPRRSNVRIPAGRSISPTRVRWSACWNWACCAAKPRWPRACRILDIAGSPTETALVRAALQARLDAADIRRRHPRLTVSYGGEPALHDQQATGPPTARR